MIADKLNITRRFVQAPNQSSTFTFENFFDGAIIEEFFWMNAINKNQIEVFEKVINYKHNYFELKFLDSEKSSFVKDDTFYAIRFLKVLVLELRKNEKRFTDTMRVIDSLIILIYKNNSKLYQLNWFVANAVLELPIKYFEDKHISFIATIGFDSNASLVSNTIKESLLPRSLKKNNKQFVTKIFKELLFISDYDKSTNENSSLNTNSYLKIDNYDLSDILKKQNLITFKDLIGWEDFSNILIEIIEKLSGIAPFEFSSINLPSIEDTNQIWNKSSFTYIIIRSLRDLMELSNPSDDFIFRKLLHSSKPILNRIGIHTVNHFYNEKHHLFWRLGLENPLNETELKHETFVLLKNNCSKIKVEQLNILFNWIDTLKVKYLNDNQTREEVEISRALIGKEYLAALNEMQEPLLTKIKDKEKELSAIHPYERDNPGFNSYWTSSSGHDYPDSQESFDNATKSATDLVNYITVNREDWSLHESEGQKDRIQYLFSSKPDLICDCSILAELDYYYLEYVIYGLQKAFENNEDIDWNSVFELISMKLEENISLEETQNRNSFIGYSCWLIRAAVQNDKRDFKKEYLIKAKDISLEFLKLDIETERRNNDPFFDIQNSPEGKILDTILHILLRNGRLYESNNNDKWFSDVKVFFSEVVVGNRLNDAYIHNIAGHLPQYAFLDMQWVIDNINFIFNKKEIENWKLSMKTYTRMASTLYKDLFNILLSNGHYDYGIKFLTGEEDGVSEFVKHIAISYTANWNGQKLNDKDSLINKLLSNSNKNQIVAIINYFFTNSNSDSENILPIWQVIFDCFSGHEDMQLIYVELLKLTSKIDYVDDSVYELIRKTILEIDDKNKLITVRGSLLNSSKNDYVYRAKLIMLSMEKLPSNYFNEKSFSDFSRHLYNHDPKFGDEFVENLLNKGCFFLLDVYNENH